MHQIDRRCVDRLVNCLINSLTRSPDTDYAAEKNPSEAATLVATVFNSLDEFDYFMRSPDEERVVAREKLNKVLLSFDSLLATVPPDVMDISSQIVATVAKAQEVSQEEDAKVLE